MKKILLCVLALLTLPGNLLLGQDIAEDWQGTLNSPPGGLRVILKIAKSGSGWSAQLFSIDQSPQGFPVSSITLSGTELKFSIDRINASYKGNVSGDGNSIIGTLDQGSPSPLTLVRATKETAWSTDPSPHTVKFVPVEKDVKLEVLDWGGLGRPLILLAGLGNDAHIFDRFAPKLTSSYHVYGITRRGFGASSSPAPTDENYSADRLGDDVLAVIDALNITRPILAGHSIAGEELSSIGSRHPEKVAGLIYLDAGYAYAFYDRAQGNFVVDSADLRRKLYRLNSGIAPREERSEVEEILKSDIPQFEKDLKEDEEELKQDPRSADKGDGKMQAPQAPTVADAILMGEQKYTEIHVPVLAIFAIPHDLGAAFKDDPAARAAAEARDLERTTAQSKAFEAGIPTAHVVRLPHANHYIFNSNEADVLREIASFTSTLP